MPTKKRCTDCPISEVCIQSVTAKHCPVKNAPDITIKPKNNKKENQ